MDYYNVVYNFKNGIGYAIVCVPKLEEYIIYSIYKHLETKIHASLLPIEIIKMEKCADEEPETIKIETKDKRYAYPIIKKSKKKQLFYD